MAGHGHVTPNPDGSKARCGGPAICPECAAEQAALNATFKSKQEPEPKPPTGTAKAISADAKSAYARQASLSLAVYKKALEAFNEQSTRYTGETADVGPLDVAMRALEHMTLLTDKLNGV